MFSPLRIKIIKDTFNISLKSSMVSPRNGQALQVYVSTRYANNL